MLASRARPTPLLVALTFALVILFYHSSHADRIYQQWSSPPESPPLTLPANRTLGFGAVVVVSRAGSQRRHSLLQASNVTDFDLTIPKQPIWTDGDLERFIDGQENVQRGSLLAWLGHLNALHWFLESGLETALILEDDVDWDIRLRSVQIPLAARAARQLLPPRRLHYPFAPYSSHETQYWGDQDAWDLLYLGHCGDYFEEVGNEGPRITERYKLSTMPHILYKDPTLPSPSDLHPFTQTLFDALGMPAHSRVFHRSKAPLCSFGYAVTRHAALRLLRDLASPRLTANGPRAFDVALLEACRNGAKTPSPTPLDRYSTLRSHSTSHHTLPSPGLRCWTLNSELFHHMPGHSLIDEIGAEMGEGPGIPPVDLAGQAQVLQRNETMNIDCGFWSGAFAFDEGDLEQLRYLQQLVGREGQCLKERNRITDDSPQKPLG